MAEAKLNIPEDKLLSKDAAQPEQATKRKPKKVWLELLRILAVFLVIFNHTGTYGFTYFTTLDGGYRYWLFMALSVLTVMNIPIFYLISGSLLLGRDEPLRVVWKKRIGRYALVIVIFTFLQYIALCMGAEEGFREVFSVKTWFVTMLTENIIVPYWFLYEYLGFLVMLPIFRRLVQNMREQDFIYLFVLYFIFTGALPVVEYLMTKWHTILNISFTINAITSDLLIYPALGYYLTRKPKPSGKTLAILWAMSLLCLFYACFMTQYKIDYAHRLSEAQVGTFFKTLICIPAATVFLTARKLFDTTDGKGITLPEGLEKYFLSFGSCVFGIYLVEQLFREHLVFVYDWLAVYLPNYVAVVLYCWLILHICFLVVLPFKHIPGIKKLI